MSAFTDAIEANTVGLEDVYVGQTSCCPTCCDALGVTEEEMEAGLEDGSICEDEGGFSWHHCDCCGSSLGGNRYAAHGFDKNKEVVHLEICEDCLIFLANGDEPEKWEG